MIPSTGKRSAGKPQDEFETRDIGLQPSERIADALVGIEAHLYELVQAQEKIADILERLTFKPGWFGSDSDALMLRVTTPDLEK